jgi:hypothetical protein
MEEQNYNNHRRFSPAFHGVLFALMFVALIGSMVNLYGSLGDHQRLYSATLIVGVMICLWMLALFCRVFALRAQDRAIRAEENLRHFALTGKLLDRRLDTRQIIGLRFASDDEFVDLARRAAAEGLSGDNIKKVIKNWRPDYYRV